MVDIEKWKEIQSAMSSDSLLQSFVVIEEIKLVIKLSSGWIKLKTGRINNYNSEL